MNIAPSTLSMMSDIQRVIADGVNVVHPRNIAQNMVKGAGTLVFKRKVNNRRAPIRSYASRLDPLPLKDQGTCSLHHVLRNSSTAGAT
jgi:hypothetical protein